MKKVLCLLACFIVFGCSNAVDNRVRRLSLVRGQIPGTAEITKRIPREKYAASLNNKNALERLRLVPILINSKTPGNLPEYRIFDIQPGGAAALLGLLNADVLVAANDYVIYEPPKFKTYLQLLAQEKNASIELRREGQPIIFKYIFE